MPEIISSIDIGTNTVTLLIAKIDNFKIVPLHQKEFIVGLGEGIVKNNLIKKESIYNCIKSLIECKNTIAKYNVDKELCVATSALRQAKNQKEIIKQIHAIKCYPKIISGNHEAKYIGNLVKFEFSNLCDNALIIDIGGGSTELIYIKNSKIQVVQSLNLGSVTLFEKFFSDPISESHVLSCNKFISEKIRNSSIKNITFTNLIGVGGTITSLSAIYNKIFPYNHNKVHKSILPIKSLDFFDEKLLYNKISDRMNIPILEYKRAKVIPAGFLIFSFIMKNFNFNKLSVCEKGLRWGVILDQLI